MTTDSIPVSLLLPKGVSVHAVQKVRGFESMVDGRWGGKDLIHDLRSNICAAMIQVSLSLVSRESGLLFM